jgi:hypothetical protein
LSVVRCVSHVGACSELRAAVRSALAMFKFLGKRGSPARQRKADDHHRNHDSKQHDSKRDTMLQEFQPYCKERHQSTVSEATTARASIDTTNFDERRESQLELQPEVPV